MSSDLGNSNARQRSPGIPPAVIDYEEKYRRELYGEEDMDDPLLYSKGNGRIYQDPRFRKHWKTIGAAAVLLTMGVMFFITALVLEYGFDHSRAFVFAIIGGICFLPGAYHCFHIYHIFQGTEGYTFQNIPSYDQ
eukprot:Nk52_evm44s1020 gene=Nk52_evmTU44s1020